MDRHRCVYRKVLWCASPASYLTDHVKCTFILNLPNKVCLECMKRGEEQYMLRKDFAR